MKWLVLLHVMTAIIGVGPTFFMHVLLRNNQTVGELRHSMKLAKALEFFPKIGGTIAVITGFILVAWQSYSTLQDLWIWTSLVLYVLIQIVVIGIVTPKVQTVAQWLQKTQTPPEEQLPELQRHSVRIINYWFALASIMGTLLFIMMIYKPSIEV